MLYEQTPPPYRLIIFAALVASLVASLLLLSPLFFLFAWFAGVMVFYSVMEPGSAIALQEDGRRCQEVERRNAFLDCLYAGGVVDDETNAEQVAIYSPAPMLFEFETRQPGKTEAMLRKAAEASLNAFGAVAVEVTRTAPSRFMVSYSTQTPAERLAGLVCPYSALLEEVNAHEH